MIIRITALFGCLTLWCQAQQTYAAAGGVIAGTITGDDGTIVASGSLMARRASVAFGRGGQTDWHTVIDNRGAFRLEGLPDGSYTLCIQVPFSAWINPCAWGLKPPSVTIAREQPSAAINVVLRKGAVIPIRVDDPGQRFSQYEGKTSGAHLLVGVTSDNRVFLPALIASQDTSGRNYRVLVPYDIPVLLVVGSSFFQLTDALGFALSRTGSTQIPLTARVGQTPPAIRLTVTGGGG